MHLMLVFLRNVCAEEIKGIPMYSTKKMKKEKMTKKERGVIMNDNINSVHHMYVQYVCTFISLFLSPF